MTPEQTALVQASFAKLTPIADTAATLFYDDLFQRKPALRFLFKEDLTEQRQKLMAMLGLVAANIGQWEKIAPAVHALGRRHLAYGIRQTDYETVGAALIATLEKGLGADFTPEVRGAWLACYDTVTAEMLSPVAPA